MAVPLKLEDTVRGVLQVFSYRLDAYSQSELEIAEAIGTQVLVAVNNALLYASLQQELQARRESEERFRRLAENSPDLIARFDVEGRYLYVNPAMALRAGIGQQAFEGKTSHELGLPALFVHLPPLDRSDWAETQIQEEIDEAGNRSFLQTRLVPERDETGQIHSWLLIGHDLTDLMTTQAALEELNQTLEARVAERTMRLAEAQRIAHLGSVEIDLVAGEAILSDEAWQILGQRPQIGPVSVEELLALLPPDDQAFYRQGRSVVTADAETRGREVQFRRVDGSKGYARIRYELAYEDGKAVRALATARDVTAQRLAEEGQRRLVAILEATPDLVVSWNTAGEIFYLNRGGQQLLNLGSDQSLLGHSFLNLFPTQATRPVIDEALPAAQPQSVWAGESAIQSSQGDIVPVSLVVIAHRVEDQPIAYYSAIMRDLTLQKAAEATLREGTILLRSANTALEETSRMKDSFLASMSHELRTPLANILATAEILQEGIYGPMNERQKQATNNIDRSGRHLLELINNILDLSKINADKFDLDLERCSVDDVCRAAIQIVSNLAEARRQQITYTIDPLPIFVQADQLRLRQILVNLLSNAVKFSPEGVQLGLEVKGDPKAGLLYLRVWDNGMGIAVEDFSRLFEPFVQLDSSLSRRYAGTGLGLALVRRMVELHGGNVAVESEADVGTAFQSRCRGKQPDQPRRSVPTKIPAKTRDAPSQ